MSHITEQREADLKVEARLLKLLCWSQEELEQLRYQNGLRYLREVLTLPDEYAAKVERSRLFWSWWINAWRRRDAAFSFRLKVQNDGTANIYGVGHSGYLNQTYQNVADAEELAAAYEAMHEPMTLPHMTPDAGYLTRWLEDAGSAAATDEENPAVRAA